MSENQTPTNPAAELVAVVEDLVERQRQILAAIVTGRPPSQDSVQAVLLGLRGVVTKLRNGTAEADATTPTNPDLREQVQRVLRDRCEVEDRQYTDGTGWVLVRDDNVAQVMADYFTPVLEGLRRERDAAQLWNKAHEINNAALGQTNRELAAEREALSPLLRGMARRVGQMRREIRLNEMFGDREHAKRGVDLEAAQHAAASWERAAHGNQEYATVLYAELLQARAEIGQLRARPSASDQTPATPDGPGFACVACDGSDLPHTCSRYRAPSSVQGDTTPGEGDQS